MKFKMLLAILVAATGLLEFRSSSTLPVAASLGVPSPFPNGRPAMIRNVDHLVFRKAMLLGPETCLFGAGFTFRLVVLPLGVPSFAPICGGLHGRTVNLRVNTEPGQAWPVELAE